MSPDRLHDLLSAYHDGRLADADARALSAELKASADARRLFWDYAHLAAGLGEFFAEDLGHRLALDETLPGERVVLPARATPAVWLRPTLMALALTLVVAVSAWLLRPAPPVRPISPDEPALVRLAELRGDVTVGEADAMRPGEAGLRLRAGEEIRTGEGGFAVLAYEDESRLELTPETVVRLLESEVSRPDARTNFVFLKRGVVNATVSPKTAGTPMVLRTAQGELRSPRGKFSTSNVMGETRVEVEEGGGYLTAGGDGRAVEVGSGIYAITAVEPGVPGFEMFQPGPLLPAGSTPFAVLEEPSGPILDMACVRKGHGLATACANGAVKIWDVATRRVDSVLDAKMKRAVCLSRSGGDVLAVGYEPTAKTDREETAVLWDINSGRRLAGLTGHRRVHAVEVVPGTRTALVTGNGRGVQVWDAPEPRPSLYLGEKLDRPLTTALSPDGKTLAAAYRDGKVRLWDIFSGRQTAVIDAHRRDAQAVAYSPDGALLATGGKDGVIRVFAAATLDEVKALRGKFGEVRGMAFSPDGLALATGHAGTVNLWNVAAGRLETSLKAHKLAVTAVVYLPDGRTLATAGYDRAVKLWAMRPGVVQ